MVTRIEAMTKDCIGWIRDWFEYNGKGCNAVVGISGGKDSSVVAALCVEALGKDRVIGVLMPDGEQADIEDAYALVKHLGIQSIEANIEQTVFAVYKSILGKVEPTEQAKINLPARVRMVTLYAISQSMNGRVANTCNKSEDYVGYATLYGDAVGDFSPLSNILVRDVIAMGEYLGLPDNLVHKTPSDGLCGQSDEDHLGFSYEVLDAYLAGDIEPDEEIKNKIDDLNWKNQFKSSRMASFTPRSISPSLFF